MYEGYNVDVSLMDQTIWIIGCGDIGCRLADLYLKHHNQSTVIRGIVRSDASRIRCEAHGVQVLQRDISGNTRLPLRHFEQADVYYFAPPPAEGSSDPVLESFLNQVENRPRRLVLISTTGVYGDSGGAWIDENSPPNPVAARAKRRLAAEQALIGWAERQNREYMILRVPGIYATDRLPLARLRKELPVVLESEAGWTNRIHADDLAQIAKSAMQSPLTNRIYNACDGHPSSITDYFNQVADYAGLPRPPQISLRQAEQTLSAGMVSYLKESRRIKNNKMLKELGIVLKYPDLKSGLSYN